MYNEYEENLFGVDMRHKPPLTILPTQEYGWGNSHHRLAYSSLNRSQEYNYSEYALNTMGFMPKNYIIVNEKEVHLNKSTAFRVSRNRVAIPVKEFARQKRLTLKEQWELMNPQWIGTFFGLFGEDPYRSRRPTLEQAMEQAMQTNSFDEFMQQFWSAKYGHQEAIERLERRARNLDIQSKDFADVREHLGIKIQKVQTDMKNGRLEIYHLQGYNVHEYLNELKARYYRADKKCCECASKSKRIKEYINSITY